MMQRHETRPGRLYAALAVAEYGTLFPHEALREILGGPVTDKRYYDMVRRVTRRLERTAQRTLSTVKGRGYRVTEPRRHLSEAHKRHVRAVRQQHIEVSVLEATYRAALTLSERKRLEERTENAKHQLQVLRSVKRTVVRAHQRVEQIIDTKLDEALQRFAGAEADVQALRGTGRRRDGVE